jgi:hypothetical protein
LPPAGDTEVAEVGDRDRGVAHLRAAQAAGPGPPDEIAEIACDFVDRLPIGVVERGRDESAAAQRDGAAHVHAGSGREPVVLPESVQAGHLNAGPSHRFDEQHDREEPLGDGSTLVLGAEPGQRPREVDSGRQVQVRDLALGAGHGRANRAAHRGEPIGWSRGRLPERRGPFDVRHGDGPAGPAPLHRVEVDVEVLRRLARRGRDARPRSAFATVAAWLERRRRRGCRFSLARRLSGRANQREQRSDRHFLTRFHDGSIDHAGVEDLDLDGALLGIDDRDDVAAGDRVARLLQPLDECAGFHVGAEGWHAELDHEEDTPAGMSARVASTIARGCGSAASSRCWG